MTTMESALAFPTRVGAYLDGRWIDAGDSYPVHDPATGGELGRAPRSTVADAHAAAAAARQALPTWALSSLDERCRLLRELAGAIGAHRADFVELVMRETGALLPFARDVKVAFTVDRFSWHATASPEWFESGMAVVTPAGSNRRTRVVRQPAGVVTCITPFNFQLPNVAAKLGAALVAGCTTILKPAPQDPLGAMALFELIEELDFPPGVVNLVVSDDVAVSQALVTSHDVDMVSFTGSTRTGLDIGARAGAAMKRTLLELGGKSALIVTEDADVPAAARAAASTWTIYAGQICTAPTRVVAHRAVYDDVVAELTEIARGLRTGDPEDPEAQIGPLITEAHRARVESYIRAGVGEGATLAVDGRIPKDARPGNFVGATLFTDCTNDMTIAREEIFGPVLCVIPAADDDDAVRLANDSDYGLDGYVWAGDGEHAWQLARRLRTGHVSVNGAPTNYEAPFGGFRRSGVGRDRGLAGVQAYTEVQAIDLPD
jgi:acyl-CoA reductase-like NAD-dependent aldehyde dehydrogenase